MRRTFVNFYLDLAALLAFLSLVTTGAVMTFVLPHGGPIGENRSTLRGAALREFSGIARHEWSDLHLYIACIFIILIAVHFFLHLEWVKGMLGKIRCNY